LWGAALSEKSGTKAPTQRAKEIVEDISSWGRGSTVAIDCAVPRREEDAAPSHSQASITRGLPSIPSIASLHASPGHGYVDHSGLRDMQARPPAGVELPPLFCCISHRSVASPHSLPLGAAAGLLISV